MHFIYWSRMGIFVYPKLRKNRKMHQLSSDHLNKVSVWTWKTPDWVLMSHKHTRVNHFFTVSSRNSSNLCVCTFIIKCHLTYYSNEDVDPLVSVLSVWILIPSVRILDETVTESRFNLLKLLSSRSSCSRLWWWSGRTDRVECVSVEVLYIRGSLWDVQDPPPIH